MDYNDCKSKFNHIKVQYEIWEMVNTMHTAGRMVYAVLCTYTVFVI